MLKLQREISAVTMELYTVKILNIGTCMSEQTV